MNLSRPTLLLIAVASPAGVLAAAASSYQAPTAPSAATLLNRMNSAYRSFRSYSDSASIKRAVGKKEVTGSVEIALQRPNRYLLELKGDKLNTVVVSDGTTLIAQRPDRKAYTKVRSPQILMGSDVLAGIDFPSPGPRIITQLLAANAREGEVGKWLLGALVSGPQAFKDKTAWVLEFPFGADGEARVTVTADDYLVRKVVVTRHGDPVWTESHDDIRTDKPVPEGAFTRPLPEGAILLSSLPPLEKPQEAADVDAAETPEDLAKDPEKLEKAAIAIYRSSGCARCHDGGAGPDLNQEGADPLHTVKWIADHIRNP